MPESVLQRAPVSTKSFGVEELGRLQSSRPLS
jgi:hypothetical protein